MTIITRLGAHKLRPEKSGPDQSAPRHRRPLEKQSDVDQAAATAFEGEIREFVRREVSLRHRQRSDAYTGNDLAAENLNALIGRVASASIEEIDRVIFELQSARDMLRSEGERVNRELAGYARLNHASMTAMKIVGDSLKQWKGAPVNHNRR